MSSAISAASRARSSRDSPASCASCSPISDSTRVADGAAVLDVEEPRPELADEREVDPVLQLGEGVGALPLPFRSPRCIAGPTGEFAIRSCSSIVSSPSAAAAAAARCRWRRPPEIAGDRQVPLGQSGVRPGRLRLRLGHDDRLAARECARDRAVAADEHVRRAAEQLLDVELRDADARVGAVEHERDRPRVVAHLAERLEADLRVLERERVEHPDHAEMRGRVDRRDHLGRERRRACRR